MLHVLSEQNKIILWFDVVRGHVKIVDRYRDKGTSICL